MVSTISISISEKCCGAPEGGQDEEIAQRLAHEHRACGERNVAAQKPQHDGDGLADGGQKGEEGHQRAPARQEAPGFVQLPGADAQPRDPLGFAHAADAVAGHAAQRVARGGGDHAPGGVETHAQEHDQDRFGAEREDASGDQRREEKAPVAPVCKQLCESFHHVACAARRACAAKIAFFRVAARSLGIGAGCRRSRFGLRACLRVP